MTDRDHRDSDVLGRYVGTPAAPVQGEEVVQGTTAVASTSVRSPHTEIASSLDHDHHTLWNVICEACHLLDRAATEADHDELEKYIWDFFQRLKSHPDTRRIQKEVLRANREFEAAKQAGDNLTGASTGDTGNCPLEPFPAESGAGA